MAKRLPDKIRTELQQKAWSLRRKLWTEQRIADELGVDQSTVSRMLKSEEERLTKEFTERALAIKITQTEQLLHIAEEASQAWDRSKEPGDKERVVTKKLGARPKGQQASVPQGDAEVPGMYLNAAEPIEDLGEITDEERARLLHIAEANGDASVLTIVEETSTLERRYQTGDPRYLAEMRGALADIRSIWGAEAPKKAEVTGKDGAPLLVGLFESNLERAYGDESGISSIDDKPAV